MTLVKKILITQILLGDSGVGKTSILNKYIRGEFISHHKPTIGADFCSVEVCYSNPKGYDHIITCQIWDTAGQERFQSLGRAFYRGVDSVVFVYDINDKESFYNVEKWRMKFLAGNSMDSIEFNTFPSMLLANKSDSCANQNNKNWRYNPHSNKNDVSWIVVSGFCRKYFEIPIDIMRLFEEYYGRKNIDKMYASQHNMLYYEVSALTGKNINKAMKE
eukprot:126381_1